VKRKGDGWAHVRSLPNVQAALARQQAEQTALRATRQTVAVMAETVGEARKPRGRQPNKTEGRWLAALAIDPMVKRVVYEGVTLRLADGMRYTPDVFVEYVDGSVGLDEVKGAFVRDTARVKYEWARQQFPAFRWRWCQFIKGKWYVSDAVGKSRLSER